MPQINMTITTESAEELRSILIDLAHIVDLANTVDVQDASVEIVVPTARKRRGRRTEVEITDSLAREEVNKIKAEAAAASAAPAVTIAPLPPTEPEAAPPVQETPAPTPTIEAVRSALKALVDAKGRDAAVKVLSEAKFEKLSDVPPQMYAAIITSCAVVAK